MKALIVSRRRELQRCYPQIECLFERTFGKPLNPALWRQYYLDNPYGPACTVMLFVDKKLVAHYGLIPQVLNGMGNVTVPYFLGITLMVAPEQQNTELFISLIRRTQEVALLRNRHFILAFPNEIAFQPLNKLFDWPCLAETPFYLMKVNSIQTESVRIRQLERIEKNGELAVPSDRIYWDWRCRVHLYQICQVDESVQLIYKALDKQTMDIMDLTAKDPRRALSDLFRFATSLGFSQIVITGYHAKQLGLEPSRLERWGRYTVRMCYCPLSQKERPKVGFNLTLCDVY